jgi:hypothetical protein
MARTPALNVLGSVVVARLAVVALLDQQRPQPTFLTARVPRTRPTHQQAAEQSHDSRDYPRLLTPALADAPFVPR